MRIARVVPTSRPHVLGGYIDIDNLKATGSYSDALMAVANVEIGYGQGAKKALLAQGVECEDFIHDVGWLQKMWAEENGFNFSVRTWVRDILYEQLKRYKPEVIFFQGTEPPGGIQAWKDFRASQPNIKVVVGQYGHTHDISTLDHAFFGFPCLVKSAREKGKSSSLLYHAFDSTVLEKLPLERNIKYDFTFSGAVGFKINSHFARYEFLHELCRRTPLELWVDEYDSMFNVGEKSQDAQDDFVVNRTLLHRVADVRENPVRLYHKVMITLKKFRKKQEKEVLPLERCKKGVYGLQVHELVRSSLMNLQYHSTAMKNEVGAHRLFHSPGAGGCLITDEGTNLRSLYEPDYEVVSYKSVDECVEKVKFLWDNPKQATQIAFAGQVRTLKDHTHDRRAPEFLSVVKSLFK